MSPTQTDRLTRGLENIYVVLPQQGGAMRSVTHRGNHGNITMPLVGKAVMQCAVRYNHIYIYAYAQLIVGLQRDLPEKIYFVCACK